MLISTETETTWVANTKEYYINKGYNFTKMRTKFKVNVKDLKPNSTAIIYAICDGCGKILKLKWQAYMLTSKINNKIYCISCAHKLYGGETLRLTKLKNGITFYQWCINNNRQDVLNLWDYNLNKYRPDEIGFSTKIKCWFKCPKGIHDSELKNIQSFTSSQTKNTIFCYKCNSIAQYIIDKFSEKHIEKYWSDKNEKSPYEYANMSNQKVWWKCPDRKHEDFLRKIEGSNKCEFRCPECTRERDESLLQEKVRTYITEQCGYKLNHEYKCNIIPINPKTKNPLPYDNEVINLKLIIEVNGEQHYNTKAFSGTWVKKDKTPEQQLYKQKLHDRYKKFIAYCNSYFYLVIPYWTDNKNEDWKKLIDNKIEEILVKNKNK